MRNRFSSRTEELVPMQRRMSWKGASARLVLRQERHVVRLLACPEPGRRIVRLLRVAGAAGDVRLDADDRLDAARLRLLVELDGAVEDAVVRQADRLLAELLGAAHEERDAREAVEQRVFGVEVQVSEHQGSGQGGIRLWG